jgi:phenylpropionate dioxygenase-like ring-hydroxylating dioxygenase large terminal subunit
MQATGISELIARQRLGWSLEQAFYISADVYEFEARGWLAQQWYVLAHCSELPQTGSFIVRDLLGESLILVRDTTGALHGFYNVCAHRGSRVCDKDGRANAFTCPYHAWTYRLDGSLRGAPALPAGTDIKSLGLRPVPVREIGGIVLASLCGNPLDLVPVQDELEPGLRYHGIPEARIAARRRYPTRGNWKLVMENFRECYHCYPSHPEYCTVMKHVSAIARQSSTGAQDWQRTVEEWLKNEADPSSPLGRKTFEFSSKARHYAASRALIGGGRKTQSQDGQAVAPLMGQLQGFDGGVSYFACEPFVYVAAPNDHAVMFQFLPTGPQDTDVVVSWLVNGAASEAAVDIQRMIWLWDVTTMQDKVLIERNAAGVLSRAYAPGPYSALEKQTSDFVGRYLRELSEHRAT